MTSDVVLTAALRNNLLSLQNTQRAIDTTQFRLATGRKVSSALDGPQAFFASQALNNRASDLTRLLDSIGQSIQVIKAADNGVTALTTLVEQADSLAANAKDALASGQAEAKIVGDVDLSGIADLAEVNGLDPLGGDILTFSATDENGDAIDIGFYNVAGGANATQDVTVGADQSIEEFIALINDIRTEAVTGSNNSDGDQVFEASLDEGGNLVIKTLNGGDFNVEFVSTGATDGDDLALSTALGFGNVAQLVGDGTGAANNTVEVTALADVALRSYALYDNNAGDPIIASASAGLEDLEDEDGVAIFGAALNNVADDFTIGINGGPQQNIELYDGNNDLTIQHFVDGINDNDNLNQYIQASYDAETGTLEIKAISSDVASIEIGAAASTDVDFGFGTGRLTGGASTHQESIRLASAAAELAQLESDYNRVLNQITELVTSGDTAYRGTNLLNGDELLTVFNENRTSTLTSFGATFTADGLGLSEANFSRSSAVDSSLEQTLGALEAIRAFGSTLANDLTIIQTRQTFTEELVNTLTAGADALTIADQNEEGAKLLALQTRQQLGVTSLSLASQSQQSILRLF